MKAACMPINHLHDPAVILSLHTASTNQTAPCFNGPPSHWTKQLTHPWSIRLIIHLFLQILQFCFWPPPAELKIQLCPIGHCTRSIKSALSKKHLPHHQHLLLQIETSGSLTFPQPESHCMSLYEFVHGGYFPDFELNVKAVPHNLPRQVELLWRQKSWGSTQTGAAACPLPSPHSPQRPFSCIDLAQHVAPGWNLTPAFCSRHYCSPSSLPPTPASLAHLPALLFHFLTHLPFDLVNM